MENMGIERMVQVLKKLNPSGKFSVLDWNTISVERINCEEMKCPEGYYLSEKNGITNKHNTRTGIYTSFQLV